MSYDMNIRAREDGQRRVMWDKHESGCCLRLTLSSQPIKAHGEHSVMWQAPGVKGMLGTTEVILRVLS